MKKILRYLSVKQLMEDIADLNGVMSVRRFVLSTMLAGVAVYSACLLYRINYIAALFVMILAVIMIPGLVRNYFMERSKASRFADVDVYLHQMTYSFIRNPKVNIALQDAYAISSGRLKRCLSRAIEELQYGMGERVYEDALKIVEEEYDCSRIRTLHKFLVSVEEKGGRYTGAMEVLIGIMISMVLAMLTTVMCSTLNMFSKEPLSITDTLAYQCVSIVFVVLCMLFYIYTRKHYGCDWIGENRTDKQIMRDYNNVFKSEAKKITLKMIPLWGIMLLTVIILILVQLKIAAICVAAVMVLFIITPFTQRKGSAGRIKNDLYCGFTEWLRDLAVNLENKPLLSAVEDTYVSCPVIMKESLGKFIYEIELNPSDIMPYYSFLSEFDVMDIQSAVRMLYSIGDLDRDSMNQTINALVRRNYELSDKAEAARYLDSTSMMRFSEYIPTFFVAFKMAVDMMLVVNMYL